LVFPREGIASRCKLGRTHQNGALSVFKRIGLENQNHVDCQQVDGKKTREGTDYSVALQQEMLDRF